MKCTDLRKKFPNVVVFTDRVELLISGDESYVFSKEAWDFFSKEFDELIKMDTRFSPHEFDLWDAYPTKCARTKEFWGRSKAMMEIYPGSHTGEWKVSFSEVDAGASKPEVKFETYLRTATGQGSVDKSKELKEMFIKIT